VHGANPDPVRVGIAKLELSAPGRLFNRDAELGCDLVHVANAEVDEGVGSSVTLML
jgi:hypothetical protein